MLLSHGCKRASRSTANNRMHTNHKMRRYALLFVVGDAWRYMHMRNSTFLGMT